MATLHEAGTDGTRNAAGHTIYAAVEVSRKSWTVALHAPDAGRIGLHTVPAADTAALAGLMDRARDTLERRHGLRPRVLCGYEAGYEGFWLARRLAQLGVEPLVLDPASLPVSRKARRPKTDRLDAAGMVRALMAFDRGEPPAPWPRYGEARHGEGPRRARHRPHPHDARLSRPRLRSGFVDVAPDRPPPGRLRDDHVSTPEDGRRRHGLPRPGHRDSP